MSSRDNGHQGAHNVVEAHSWLARTIESLLEQGKYAEAIRALDRLLTVAGDTQTKLFCYENLGVLAYHAGDVAEARQAFEQASHLQSNHLQSNHLQSNHLQSNHLQSNHLQSNHLQSNNWQSGDAGLSYALGHCAAADGRWWRALLQFLIAVHRAQDRIDEAEFMRAGGVAMQQLGFPDTALSMFLGALDRSPDNPWILESISQYYEYEGRWFEALDVQEALIDVLADGLPASPTGDDAAEQDQPIDRLIRRFISMWTLDRQAIEKRVRAITDKLRSEIGVVRDGHASAPEADAGLVSLNLPAGLHLLVEQLAMHERNFLLLETAQSLWAKARHDRFDVHLTPYTLAGAIQAVCERLHWRDAASFDALSQLYGVEADTLQAATRLIAGRFEVRFIPEQDHYLGLDSTESRRLVNIQRAILYGVDVGELESSLAMLGD